ncbi:MAG TPA: hypothetical protein VK008_02325 [Sphingobacteriaceae bacterium]|nr:hypothetical protein [Sphingobacteriaceae bacterium]
MYEEVRVPEPRFVRELMHTKRYAWLWMLLRVYVGWQWLKAGWGKVGAEAWKTGAALQGFWSNAVAVPEGARPVITYDWYRAFLTFLLEGGHYTWFGPLIAWGETLVGVALIVGAFTGIAAFFGAFMNFNFMLAGTTSTNPVLFTLAVLLILGWRVAGQWGLDAYLLTKLGTPWAPVKVRPRNVTRELRA